MNIEDIRAITHRCQVECNGLSKNEIIRKIQRQNSHDDCATYYRSDCRHKLFREL